MPYRFALSREQRSTLPLVNSFLLRDCKNGMHFLPRIVYNLDLYLVFSSSFFFFSLFLSQETKVTRFPRRGFDRRSKLEKSVYLRSTIPFFPFARRATILARVQVPASSIPRHPNFPRRSLANLGSLFFGDAREVHGALVNVFMGLWDN